MSTPGRICCHKEAPVATNEIGRKQKFCRDKVDLRHRAQIRSLLLFRVLRHRARIRSLLFIFGSPASCPDSIPSFVSGSQASCSDLIPGIALGFDSFFCFGFSGITPRFDPFILFRVLRHRTRIQSLLFVLGSPTSHLDSIPSFCFKCSDIAPILKSLRFVSGSPTSRPNWIPSFCFGFSSIAPGFYPFLFRVLRHRSRIRSLLLFRVL